MNSRRSFVLGAGGTAISLMAGKASANSRVQVAVLGVHGRGTDHIRGLNALPNAEVVMLCDPDRNVLTERAEQFETKYHRKVRTEQDLRRVFDNKEIDAVSIATPNHWHALAAIWACQAGKDVYVEKPGAHTIYEGRKLIEATHRYNRIVQHGVQLRSSEAIKEAVQLMNKGVIGNVYMARGLVFRLRPSVGHKGNEPTPEYLNWDIWQGPAGERPFTRALVHYNWHWHWDYGDGDVGNQGIHETDMCMWGLGVGLPTRVTSMGGKFLWDDDKETPETLTSVYHYPEQKKIIQFEVRPWYTNTEGGVGVGNIFYGSDGYLAINGYDSYEVYLGEKREPGPKRKAGGDHYANFIKAVESRKSSDLDGPVETAHMASALAHLGNISYRLGRQLQFNPAVERFVGDEEANLMLTRNYRAPYVVPERV